VNLVPHATFIVAAYAVTVLTVAALIVWVMFDNRAQRRELAKLEARGVSRRSGKIA
jgi:heme exporter protein D